ncbi:MAG: hypothetical protein P1P88_10005 [Bacteroidales bacterium]|nr:hypothetical protein [Bacteroidales bacterium]
MKSIFIIANLILLTTESFFQNSNQVNNFQKNEDPRIIKISKWYQEIQNNVKNDAYEIVNNQNVCYLTKKDKKLVLVSVGVYNDYNEFVEEYYIRNDKLFFYYSKETSMENITKKPGGITNEDETEAIEYSVQEKRIYFDNDKAIRHLIKEVIIKPGENHEEEILKAKNKYETIDKIDPELYIIRVNRWIKELN